MGKLEVSFTLKERIKGPHFPDTEVGEARLYNLANDLSETTNVIDKHPEVVTKMNQWIEQVRSDMGDWGYEGRNQRPAGIIDEPFPVYLNKRYAYENTEIIVCFNSGGIIEQLELERCLGCGQ